MGKGLKIESYFSLKQQWCDIFNYNPPTFHQAMNLFVSSSPELFIRPGFQLRRWMFQGMMKKLLVFPGMLEISLEWVESGVEECSRKVSGSHFVQSKIKQKLSNTSH